MVSADERLSGDQKAALLAVYRSMQGRVRAGHHAMRPDLGQHRRAQLLGHGP